MVASFFFGQCCIVPLVWPWPLRGTCKPQADVECRRANIERRKTPDGEVLCHRCDVCAVCIRGWTRAGVWRMVQRRSIAIGQIALCSFKRRLTSPGKPSEDMRGTRWCRLSQPKTCCRAGSHFPMACRSLKRWWPHGSRGEWQGARARVRAPL